MSRTTLDQVITVVARTFDCPEQSLNGDSSAVDVDGWDSVSHAMLVLDIEDEFGIVIDFERALDAPNLAALASYIDEIRG